MNELSLFQGRSGLDIAAMVVRGSAHPVSASQALTMIPKEEAQKAHERVHVSPNRRNVANPLEKHSFRFGQRLERQTVFAPDESIEDLVL